MTEHVVSIGAYESLGRRAFSREDAEFIDVESGTIVCHQCWNPTWGSHVVVSGFKRSEPYETADGPTMRVVRPTKPRAWSFL